MRRNGTGEVFFLTFWIICGTHNRLKKVIRIISDWITKDAKIDIEINNPATFLIFQMIQKIHMTKKKIQCKLLGKIWLTNSAKFLHVLSFVNTKKI